MAISPPQRPAERAEPKYPVEPNSPKSLAAALMARARSESPSPDAGRLRRVYTSLDGSVRPLLLLIGTFRLNRGLIDALGWKSNWTYHYEAWSDGTLLIYPTPSSLAKRERRAAAESLQSSPRRGGRPRKTFHGPDGAPLPVPPTSEIRRNGHLLACVPVLAQSLRTNAAYVHSYECDERCPRRMTVKRPGRPRKDQNKP